MPLSNFIATLLFASATLATAQNLTLKEHGKLVKEISVNSLSETISAEDVTVDDANELDSVTYKAISANALFQKIYGDKWRNAEEILITCLDGYQISITEKKFDQAQAYLAFTRLKSSDFAITNKHERGKRVQVGPLYLVWKGTKVEMGAWPYQIASIDLVTLSEIYPRLAPPANSSKSAKNGFTAFKNNCLSCHTINGDGGSGGPELNYPVNVTEYYKENWLRKWISDPTSIRFKTDMPGLAKDVPHHDLVLNDILSYLKAMAKNKVAPLKKSD